MYWLNNASISPPLSKTPGVASVAMALLNAWFMPATCSYQTA
jgi:hypothetical protein